MLLTLNTHTLNQRHMPTSPSLKNNILPFDGEAYLDNQYFSSNEAGAYFNQINQDTEWQQKEIRLFGKLIQQPRLMAWHGDKNITYQYSNLRLVTKPWTPVLTTLKNTIERDLGHTFNAVLLNCYRNGHDYMGWHRDNEKVLGLQPLIVSISFGAKRIFKFRHYYNKQLSEKLELDNGSLLIMQGETQNYWSHSLPKSLRITEPRINLTFRNIHQLT
jgi:alkylated DNA repair dioxygenase AlkB